MNVPIPHMTLKFVVFLNYCWWFRNPTNQLKLVVYPIIYGPGFSTISGGWEWDFRDPSTVVIYLEVQDT